MSTRSATRPSPKSLLEDEGRRWHVISNEGQWVVKRGGAQRATRSFAEQAQAIELARSLAKDVNGEVIVHRKDGTMEEREVARNGQLVTVYRYRKDPNPPKG